MLQVQHLQKSYGVATVLAGVSFIVNDGEHVGLIGPNGAGKSTLLRCIIGHEQPDSGSITLSPPGLSLGYVPQSFADLLGDRTIAEIVAEAQAEYVAAETALNAAAEALSSAADMDAALAAYDTALAQFEALGGYEREHRAAAVLEGLGLSTLDLGTPAKTLSGGQKTRLGLATLLLRAPDLLLLDEPTNHLDVVALEWLENFVRSYSGAVLIVSHDREFLDQTVARILYLDLETHGIKSYTGNYSDFADARAREREQQYEAWQDQQDYIHTVEADIQRVKGRAMNIQNGPKRHRDHYGRVSVKIARLARARARKLERYLDSDERVEKPKSRWGLKLDFGPPPPGGRAVLRVEDVAFAYDEARASAQASWLLQDVSFEVAYGERVALVGPNGAG
jgi:ATPase subunit of ABC transporter with duplicated ATPase domains